MFALLALKMMYTHDKSYAKFLFNKILNISFTGK